MKFHKKSIIYAMVMILAAGLSTGCKKKNEGIKISNAWVTETHPGSTSSGAYMNIANLSESDDVLLGITADDFKMVEFHMMKTEDGVMKMEPTETIGIKAGSEISFAPGGMHIMLMNNKKELKSGDEETLTLEFEKAGKMVIHAPVKKLEEQVN